MERRGEFAAASLQTESYLEREHDARWTVLGVGYATRGITANVLTLLLPPQTFLRATSSILTYKLRGAKRWNNGNRVLITMSSTARIPYSEFSLLTLIGTAFPQRNEVRTHLCLGSTEIAQWIVRAAAALSLQCTYVLIHRYSCLLLR